MTTVRSTWTGVPVPVDGMLPAAEWAGAASMPIPAGYLLVKNDADNLYIALDLVSDTGNDVGTNDYYWFVVDSDNNGTVTPNRDMLFSPWPGNPNRLGLWLMAWPNATWPAQNDQVIASTTRGGFGPSPHSATSHRMWELRLSLKELSIVVDPNRPPPTLRFGLRIASSSPAFIFEYPSSPLSAFQSFHEIVLATQPTASYSAGTAGEVIGGVGLVPATKIGPDGYATIKDPYFVQPDEAAFSGTLNLIGNTATLPGLRGAGASKYQVQHRCGNSQAEVDAAAWAPIRQSWSNYRWTGTTYVWEGFGPDANGMYPLVAPTLDYSTKALLFQWSTWNEPNNLHQFRLAFFNDAGVSVKAPAQILTLRLDNQQPTPKLLKVLHDGAEISPCAVQTMSGPADGVQFVFTAFDPEGDLESYQLLAEYGAGNVAVIVSDSYANPANRTPTHIWQGLQGVIRPEAGEWVPPVTCAYRFRVAVRSRVTNGYSYPLYSYVSDFQTVTLIKPGPSLIRLKAAPPAAEVLPFGFASRNRIGAPGIEPKLLGRDTPIRQPG